MIPLAIILIASVAFYALWLAYGITEQRQDERRDRREEMRQAEQTERRYDEIERARASALPRPCVRIRHASKMKR